MLPKKNRLSKKEILELIPKAKTLRGDFLYLKFKLLDDKKEFKAGISISKKISKSAVVRNKTRRSIYRRLFVLRKTINPAALFFIVNKISDRGFLEKDLDKLLLSANITKSEKVKGLA